MLANPNKMNVNYRGDIGSGFYVCSTWLIYTSMAIVILDGIFGLDIFLNNSDRLSLLYRAGFLLKFLIVILGICFFSKIPKDFFIIGLLIVLFSKSQFGLLSEEWQIKSYIAHLYFYSFILLGYIFGWQLSKANLSKIKISIKVLQIAILSTLLVCLIYFSAYRMGYIVYFGMGLQTYIFVAVYLATYSSKFYHFIIFLTIILTGKRSSILIYLGQIFAPKLFSGRFSLIGILTGFITFAFFLYLVYAIGLMARFQGILNLILEFDLDEFEKNRFLFFMASGGRTEEIYAYFFDINQSFVATFLGQSAGYTFPITDSSGDIYQHYYFHISPFNLIFHFGVPVGVFIIIHQLKVFLWAVKFVSREKNIFCLLFIGFYLSSLFGAIVIVDIVFWVLYFYCHFLRQVNFKARRLTKSGNIRQTSQHAAQ